MQFDRFACKCCCCFMYDIWNSTSTSMHYINHNDGCHMLLFNAIDPFYFRFAAVAMYDSKYQSVMNMFSTLTLTLLTPTAWIWSMVIVIGCEMPSPCYIIQKCDYTHQYELFFTIWSSIWNAHLHAFWHKNQFLVKCKISDNDLKNVISKHIIRRMFHTFCAIALRSHMAPLMISQHWDQALTQYKDIIVPV